MVEIVVAERLLRWSDRIGTFMIKIIILLVA